MYLKLLLLLLAIIAIAGIVWYLQRDTISTTAEVKSVGVAEFKGLTETAENSVLVDFRTPQEVAQGQIEGALNIDFYADDLEQKLAQLDKNQEYLIYCNSGNRSKSAMKIMQNMGFTNIKELNGGIQDWNKAQYDVCVRC